MNQIKSPLLLAVGLAAGILIGFAFSKPDSDSKGLSISLQKFKEVLTQIDRNYVDEVDTEELVETAIVHMLDKLDPHSVYISAEDKVLANEDLQGNFEGIGIEFNIFKDTIVVISPLSGGPSEAAGLRAGDKIIEVDGKVIAGTNLTNRDVQRYLKGPKDSKVKIGIARKGSKDLIEFEIIRDRIPQYSVDASYLIDDITGYIKISRFSATTYAEFKEALTKLKEKGMERLILDLQGNPGGYMNHAIKIADEFLPEERKIVYTKGKEFKFDSEANTEFLGDFEKGPLMVLVNEGSASASEIVSGALQDNDRAIIVGRRTFGKGLVQLPINISDGSEIRLTISRYYTPSGRSIQKPYNDNDHYGEDIMNRYTNGELFNSDSIKFADSLKYETLKGRVVYGGGGIMPDYFIPLDTNQNSVYLNKLFNYNAVQEFAFKYYEENKSKLEKMEYDDFRKNFEMSKSMFEQLAKIGETNGVKKDTEDINKNKDLIELHIKAQIARRVWGNDGFYPIFNETNEVLQGAVKLFDKSEELERAEF
ncbi:MAG: S41 family peptidase [Cyclobacteriaceae bacterium]|nr:S41 family peptidase [Cyclobacteriaceae bacterium]